MGKDMHCSTVVSCTVADLVAPSLDTPWALFDALWEAFVYLGPTVRWKKNPTLSKLMSQSQDLLLEVLLRALPPTTALRQHVQMPHHMDTESDFAADFDLPSSVASSQTVRLLDGR